MQFLCNPCNFLATDGVSLELNPTSMDTVPLELNPPATVSVEINPQGGNAVSLELNPSPDGLVMEGTEASIICSTKSTLQRNITIYVVKNNTILYTTSDIAPSLELLFVLTRHYNGALVYCGVAGDSTGSFSSRKWKYSISCKV